MTDREMENAARIAAYLENKLSPQEREAFKRALGEDDQLRLQYVDALMGRAGSGGNAPAGAVGGGPSYDEATHGEAPETSGDNDAGAAWMSVMEERLREGSIGEADAVRQGWQDQPGAGGDRATVESGGLRQEEAGEARRIDEGETRGIGEYASPEGAAGDPPHESRPEAAAQDWEPRGQWVEGEGGEVTRERESKGEGGQGMREWEGKGEHGATEAWEARWAGGKKKTRKGFLGSGWMVGTAVLLLIVAAVAVILLVRRQGFWDKAVQFGGSDSAVAKANAADNAGAPVAGASAASDSGKGSGTGSSVGNASAGVTGGAISAKADSVYARLYRPYMRGDDPVEIRQYYTDYKSGNYAAVLAVGDSTGLGTGQKKVVIRDYMRLYRGLSLLATGDARGAVPELEGVVLRTKPGNILYETAQWYLALAWLKRTDADPTEAQNNALGLAREVSHGYSRYSWPAQEFVTALAK